MPGLHSGRCLLPDPHFTLQPTTPKNACRFRVHVVLIFLALSLLWVIRLNNFVDIISSEGVLPTAGRPLSLLGCEDSLGIF